MGKITLEDLIKVVQQPEHSRQKLIAYQEKYGISTVEFVLWHKEGIPLPITDKDCKDWQFQLEMFLAAEGDMLELTQRGRFDTQSLPLIA
jgi:hypothetical protein